MKRRKSKDDQPAPEAEPVMGAETEGPAPEPPAPEAAPLESEPQQGESPAESAQEIPVSPIAGPPPLNDQVARLKDQLVRAQAEVVNIQKRMQREFDQRLRYGIQEFAVDIVGVLDHLHRALEHLRTSQSDEVKGFLQGAELIEKEFTGALARHEVERISAKGEPFDPDLHDAVMMQPSAEVEPGTVIEELRAGYRLKDRVIRPAQVIVSRAPDEPAEPPAEDEG